MYNYVQLRVHVYMYYVSYGVNLPGSTIVWYVQLLCHGFLLPCECVCVGVWVWGVCECALSMRECDV